MTQIKEIVSGLKKIDVEGYILEKRTERTVTVKAENRNVVICEFLLGATKTATDTDTITLVLWGADVDKVRVGDKLKIENGFATSFKGIVQLNVGKYGKLSIVS